MDNNYSDLNTESWEYSLEAILAEYALQPEPETPRTPEETRSREIVMEALSERIAASVERSADFPEEIAPRKAKRGLFQRDHAEKTPQPLRAEDAAPEAEAPAPNGSAPAAERISEAESELVPAVSAEEEAVKAIPEETPTPRPTAPKGASIFNIADILAEVRAAEAAGRDTAEITLPLPPEAAETACVSPENEEPEAVPESETEAVELSGDESEAYAPAGAYAPPPEDETEAEKSDGKSRPSLLVSLMAALLIRRQQKHARAKAGAAPESDGEEGTPEVSPKAASKYYLRSATPYKMRFGIAVLLCLILLYISWGLPLAGGMKDPRICAGMCMVLEMAVMLLGLDVFTNGLMSLCRGKPGLSSLASVSCVCSIADALIMMLGGPQRGLPYCGVSAVSLCLALLGERLLCMGMALSFHTAAAAKEPAVVTSEQAVLKEERVLLKSDRSIRGFVNYAQEPDAPELAYSTLAPILLVAAPVLAFLATVCRKQAGDFFHCLSALTAVSASFSAFLSFTLPFNVISKRLASVGAAIAGWAGCADMGESKRLVVTDGDIFPAGNVLIDTIRILEGVYTDKVISYAGSVVAFSGSGLASAFTDLMRRNGCSLHQVENFACHKGGGLTAIVRGEQVFVGSSSFMNLMGIRLPQSQMANTSVFVAISGELVGVFSIRYTPTAAVQGALVSLMSSRGTEPLFAIRDFNVTPSLIKQRFRLPAVGFDFPSVPERYRISGIAPEEKSRPAAVLVRKGLAPYAEAAQAGRSLYRGSRACLFLSLLCSVLGMLLMFFLCAAGAYDSASAGNILLFMLLWLVPVAAVSLGLRR